MCQYFRSLALTVWELWSFEDLEEKDDLLYQSMTKVFVEQPCYTGSDKYRINQSITPHVRRPPARNPRKTYLAETFISSSLLCLLCYQYSIPVFQTTFYFSPLSKIPVALLKLGSPVKVSVKPTGTATLGRSAQIYTVLLYRTSGRLGGSLQK